MADVPGSNARSLERSRDGRSPNGATNTVLTHPQFDRPAVENKKHPGPKKGTLSLARARRRKEMAAALRSEHGQFDFDAAKHDTLKDLVLPRDNDEHTIRTALEILTRQMHKPGILLNRPAAAREFVALHLGSRQREAFGVLFLDAQRTLIEFAVLFEGGVSACQVYPREIARKALLLNASAVIVTHNHPSTRSDPSEADLTVTRAIKAALASVDVALLDHLIVGGTCVMSLAEAGHMA